MPDWLAHVLFVYILCTILGTRFETFKKKEYVAIAMIGSLIPDFVKIELVFDFFNIGIDVGDFLHPIHTPAGSFLLSCIISLFFSESVVLLLLTFGFITHFMLDLLMGHVSGGILILFPFSWSEYQLGLIQSDDFRITIVILILAVALYFHERVK